MKELVRAQLEAGHFQSVDEVVCAALRLLHEREELFASHRDELRAQIAEGVAAEERDLEDIFFEVKERHGLLVAERVYSNLLRTFDLLANMPEMGLDHGVLAAITRSAGA